MARPSLPAAAVLVLALPALAGCLAAPEPVDSTAVPSVEAVGRTVVHLVGGVVAQLPAGAASIAAVWRDIGHNATEPTLGVTSDGTLFYAAAVFFTLETGQRSIRTDVLRSRDGGVTWEDVSPHLPTGHNAPPTTGDPYVYVDPATDRVFTYDMFPGLACGYLSWSDDQGESWTSNPAGCAHPPPWDHQTLAAGAPRALPTAGYDNLVYHCVNRITDAICARSLDGGRTFQTTPPAYPGVEAADFVGSIAQDPGVLLGNEGPRGFCGGLHGHLVAAPDGTLYLPKDHCGRPWVAVSADDGLTWERVMVTDVPLTGGPDPAVAVDAAGNVYYTFVNQTGQLYLSISRDAGATWGAPMRVSAPAVTAAHLPAIDAGDEGKVVIAYTATENLPLGYANEDFGQGIDEWEAINASTWNGYLAVFANALDAAPLIQTTMVNDPADPLVRGYCGPGRCPGMYDFIDVVIGADGRPYAAFVDACLETCATPEGKAEDSQGQKQGRAGALATLLAGPRLRGEGALAPL